MTREEQLGIAEDLDGMEEDVTTWEATFLESVLVQLRAGRGLSDKQENTLLRMKLDYLE